MTMEESLARYGLVPKEADLPAIRALLRAEIELEKAGETREDNLSYLCAAQLFSRAHIDDVLLIWAAKQTSFDLGCMLDVELLCGAGFEATKDALMKRPETAAKDALDYIERCAPLHFQDFDPARQLDGYRRYFGVAAP